MSALIPILLISANFGQTSIPKEILLSVKSFCKEMPFLQVDKMEIQLRRNSRSWRRPYTYLKASDSIGNIYFLCIDDMSKEAVGFGPMTVSDTNSTINIQSFKQSLTSKVKVTDTYYSDDTPGQSPLLKSGIFDVLKAKDCKSFCGSAVHNNPSEVRSFSMLAPFDNDETDLPRIPIGLLSKKLMPYLRSLDFSDWVVMDSSGYDVFSGRFNYTLAEGFTPYAVELSKNPIKTARVATKLMFSDRRTRTEDGRYRQILITVDANTGKLLRSGAPFFAMLGGAPQPQYVKLSNLSLPSQVTNVQVSNGIKSFVLKVSKFTTVSALQGFNGKSFTLQLNDKEFRLLEFDKKAGLVRSKSHVGVVYAKPDDVTRKALERLFS